MVVVVKLPYRQLHGLEDAQGNFEYIETHWPTGSGGGPGPPGPTGPQGPAGAPGAAGGAAYTQTIGDGTSQAFNVTHSLGVQGVQVTVYTSAAPYSEVEADVEHTDVNTITVRTTTVPASGELTVVASAPGSTGGGGGTGGPLSYVYTQVSAATLWDIVHSLGWYPNVTVIDSGSNVLLVDVHYVSVNELTVSLSAPTSGKAYLS
jgi:hypothetical protein